MGRHGGNPADLGRCLVKGLKRTRVVGKKEVEPGARKEFATGGSRDAR